MTTAAIIEARMTSSRLPGKVLRPVLDRPLLAYMIERLHQMRTIDTIIVATTTNVEDDPIVACATQQGAKWFRGSEHDVLGRVLQAAQQHQVDVIVETTADCPLIDPVESDKVVQRFQQGDVEYASNVLHRSYPRGMDTQVFATASLADVAQRTQHPTDHEHPTYYIYQHPELYRLANVSAPASLTDPELRLTVDTPEDLQLIQAILTALWPKNPRFLLADILAWLAAHPEIAALNRHVQQKIPTYA